jgi:hypothetical protein
MNREKICRATIAREPFIWWGAYSVSKRKREMSLQR